MGLKSSMEAAFSIVADDVTLVTDATWISTTHAVELLTQTNGSVDEAIYLFLPPCPNDFCNFAKSVLGG